MKNSPDSSPVRKVTLRVAGYENPIDYLIDEGYLSRAEFRSLLYEGGYVPSVQDLDRISNSLDVPLAILNRLAQDEQRNLVIVRELEQLANNHPRILFFAATVDHARLIADRSPRSRLGSKCCDCRNGSARAKPDHSALQGKQ